MYIYTSTTQILPYCQLLWRRFNNVEQMLNLPTEFTVVWTTGTKIPNQGLFSMQVIKL